MSAAVPPLADGTPGLSEPQRILNTFFAPSKTFEDIRRNASWWVPFLLAAIMATLFAITVDKKVGWQNALRDVFSSNSAFQQLPPDAQQRQLHAMANGYKYGGYGSALFVLLFFGLLPAGVLILVFNFVLEAEVSFKQTMAIWFYSWLPNVISAILTIISILLGDPENFNIQNPLASNAAYFLDRNTSKFLYTMATGLDVFSIWMIILLGMGFAINSARKKVKTSTAITTVAIIYLFYKLGQAGLAALRG